MEERIFLFIGGSCFLLFVWVFLSCAECHGKYWPKADPRSRSEYIWDMALASLREIPRIVVKGLQAISAGEEDNEEKSEES